MVRYRQCKASQVSKTGHHLQDKECVAASLPRLYAGSSPNWEHEGIGKHDFTFLPLVVAYILPKKGANSYQERCFSRCTFLDDKYRRRMGDLKFEMQVLLAVNHDFIKTRKDFRMHLKDSPPIDDKTIREK